MDNNEHNTATIIPFPGMDCGPVADSIQTEAKMHYLIGLMYEYGRGVKPDLDEAIRWYQRAARRGLAHAQNCLGFLYSLGQGLPRDPEKAREWLYRAAAQGHAGAQLNLGMLYSCGRGVEQDETLAVYWFKRAADGGNKQAQELLARAYAQGWYGLPRDDDRADYWSRCAAGVFA